MSWFEHGTSRIYYDALASRIGDAEIIEVEGAGHGVHEDRPEWFIQTVVDWLAKH
jgi:pimeloyl-ACP methyl ester carboxylesterase